MPALAITDHLSLSGVVEFYISCKNKGIKPIIGLEFDLSLPSQLAGILGWINSCIIILLALDISGWINLCRQNNILITGIKRYPMYKHSIELLARYSTGFLCLTGGKRGLLTQLFYNKDKEKRIVAIK